MKLLVFGAGVLGSYLAHVLHAAGHDVSLLARGTRLLELKHNGLVIRHYLQRVTTVDHLRVVDVIDPSEQYDAVFMVMQYQQIQSVLSSVAACNTPLVVIVGNNPEPFNMKQTILAQSHSPKAVLFGFQQTGGRWKNGEIISVHKGAAGMKCGFCDKEADFVVKARMAAIFDQTSYQVTYYSNMDAWYKCHMALILPIAYVCYANDCNLMKSTRVQRMLMIDATKEGYGLLKALGYPILPEGDEQYFEQGSKRKFMSLIFFIMAKTMIGKLVASDHCRSAVDEMQALHAAFSDLRAKKPEYPMPAWSALEKFMPIGEYWPNRKSKIS